MPRSHFHHAPTKECDLRAELEEAGRDGAWGGRSDTCSPRSMQHRTKCLFRGWCRQRCQREVEPGLLSPAAPVAVTACVDGICQIQTYTPATSPIFVAVTPVNNGDVIVSVSLTAGAQQISTGKTATRTVKSQPNGPGCPPTVWEAKVIAHDNGHLSG